MLTSHVRAVFGLAVLALALVGGCAADADPEGDAADEGSAEEQVGTSEAALRIHSAKYRYCGYSNFWSNGRYYRYLYSYNTRNGYHQHRWAYPVACASCFTTLSFDINCGSGFYNN